MTARVELNAFTNSGSFWRGNLHTHSDRSDGCLTPQEVCRRYKAEGYDFIALTDHFIGQYGYPITNTIAFRDESFTTIIGAELHSGAMNNGELWHILAVGLPENFKRPNAPSFLPLTEQETGAELAQRAVSAGAYVVIAHPQWSGMTYEDAMSIKMAHAVEVYNHGCAMGCDRPDGFHMLDLMLSSGRHLNLIATDDAHFTEPDHFGGWVMVKATENSPEVLLAALKNGAFYSTQGPDFFDISVEDGAVRVESSAVTAVIVQGHGCAALAVHGQSMTKTEVPLKRFANSPWIRVTIVDQARQKAWSNPIWFAK